MAAARANKPDYFPLFAGQSAGVIRDLPSAGDVVKNIVAEADAVMRNLVIG